MKKIVCVLLAVMLLLCASGCGTKDDTDPATYERFAAANGVMPTFDELGEYKDYDTLYHHGSSMPFEWDAFTLVAEYYIGNYEKAKQEVIETYDFQETTITDKVGERVEPVFYTDGYQFRVLDLNTYCDSDNEFPEEIYLIGFNDERSRIAYLYFIDPDLDTISDNGRGFEEFLTADCGWNIMKDQ